jgi:hypothetical protein
MEAPKQTKKQLVLIKKVIAQLNNCCVGSVPDTPELPLTTTVGNTVTVFTI